jgi:hypothetical protein
MLAVLPLGPVFDFLLDQVFPCPITNAAERTSITINLFMVISTSTADNPALEEQLRAPENKGSGFLSRGPLHQRCHLSLQGTGQTV